jgi:hypothetical protein
MNNLPVEEYYVRFEVFTAVTMKNGVFWNVMPWGVTFQKTPFFIGTAVKTSNLHA